jgi:hypothetical protein
LKMRLFNYVLISLLLALPSWGAEDLVLKVKEKSEQVTGVQDLGTLKVDGVGVVRLTARRDGKQLLIQAAGRDGTVVGKAETVVGLHETPLYVKTPSGLKQLTIRWGHKEK